MVQVNEIERLYAWLYPRGDLLESGEAEFDQYLKSALGSELQARPDPKQMRENTKFAWEISPQMAVYMGARSIKLEDQIWTRIYFFKVSNVHNSDQHTAGIDPLPAR